MCPKRMILALEVGIRMERRKLSEEEINAALAALNGWEYAHGMLQTKLKFADFAASLQFVNRVGALAEAADHHPDITFGWGYCEIQLTTHDRGGVTDVDIALAAKVDMIKR